MEIKIDMTRKRIQKRDNEIEQIIDGTFDLACSLKFQRKVKHLRVELGIPDHGFPDLDIDRSRFHFADYEPSKWEPKPSKERSYLEVEKHLKSLTKDFGHDSNKIRLVLRLYLFHNIIDDELLREHAVVENMASLVDNIKEFEEYSHSPGVLSYFLKEKYSLYPLSIRISPYSTREQFLSFIDANWAKVEKIQKEYRMPNIQMGKLRSRKVISNEIKLFIAENFTENNNRLAEDIEEKFKVTMTVNQIRSIKHRLKKTDG